MKTKILIIVLVGLFLISSIANSSLAANDKSKGKSQSPGEKARAPALEKIEFIHYKKDSGKTKPGTECGNDICEPGENARKCPEDCVEGGDPEPPDTATCYAFMGQYGKKYIKWNNLPVYCEVNPASSPSNLDAISFGVMEWDEATSANLFVLDVWDSGATYNVQDYINVISFDDYYDDPDIIGACMVWYNPATKAIVEFDIVFETDYTWGDAGVTNEYGLGDTSVMDLQNIATHEIGHALGLADIYDEAQCSEVTMYGYSKEGETKKRTIELPDETGIHKLYGP